MINEQKQLFPFCLVWTMIPCISWIFPFIGHTGICDSQGIVSDFLGYHINKKHMAFGRPIKYTVINPPSLEEYDIAIYQTNLIFSSQAHDLCCNNCHHHVADVLNRIRYKNKTNWTQMNIWWMCLWDSSYVNKWYVFKVYLPFIILCLIVILLSSIAKKN